MILIYTHKLTPRVAYTFKHIFKRILQVEVGFTCVADEFLSYEGPKLSYTQKPLAFEFFVRSSPLLFEQGIRDVEFNVHDWEGVPCFFIAGEKSALPYDIFAASFFLISRYEEYYPQVHDQYDRYEGSNSTAVQNGFIERPVIDIWAMKLLKLLKKRFPNYRFTDKQYENVSTINVNEAFAYRGLGFFRHTIGLVQDIFKFKIEDVIRRFTVVLRIKKDPYDNYKQLVETAKKHNKKIIFFFLFSEYNTYDKNISFSNYNYKMLVKALADVVPFGILFSYFTLKNSKKIIKEKNRFESVVIRPVIKSRQHFNRLEIPKTYQILIENDIKQEHTMGYHTHLGFRASTCSPFYFYDLEYEIQTPLRVFPFCVMDELMKNKLNMTPAQAKTKIKQLQEEVKAVNGMFISIFHNHTMSDMETNKGWDSVYEAMIQN